MKAAITINNLSFAYNGVQVLNNVSIDIEQGKLTFILGKNVVVNLLIYV